MRPKGLILSALTLVLASALPAAADSSADPSLKQLDPQTRLVQVCDLAVMDKTSSRKDGVTERAFIDALHRAHIDGNTAYGDGGAFRRKGEWYEFSYRCTVTPDHMRTTALEVDVKRLVPHAEWAAKNLYP
jgi:hypothetical protein